MKKNQTRNYRVEKRRAFTLLQILAVMAIITLLGVISFGYLQRSRRGAQAASCDTRLKAITLALDAFRQERGSYPLDLNELVSAKYITDVNMMRCPLDPRPAGSYAEYYVYRGGRPASGDTRNQESLPLVVCPFHEEASGHGIQAFHSGTKGYSVMKATLSDCTGATVERPGKPAVAGRNGMVLFGGDRVKTSGGTATIQFSDGSYAKLNSQADVTVLQSFLTGQNAAPLYTVLRQNLGEVFYRVNPGSKFDVTTPTATAGALGTEFSIKREGTKWYLRVTESRVLCNKQVGSGVYTPSMTPNNLIGSNWNEIGTETTVSPTPTPTPRREDDDDD